MADVNSEDTMHRRETLMADERRKLYYFTFSNDSDESGDVDSDTKTSDEEAGNE